MSNATTPQSKETSLSSGGTELATISKILMFDVPVAITQLILGSEPERKTVEAVWAGYDTVVRWAASAVDTVYRSQVLSEMFGNTVNQLLRWQQTSNIVKDFVTTSALKSLGLPTSAEIQALTGKINTLETQLAKAVATRDIRPPKRRRAAASRPRLLKSLQTPPVSLPAQTLDEAA